MTGVSSIIQQPSQSGASPPQGSSGTGDMSSAQAFAQPGGAAPASPGGIPQASAPQPPPPPTHAETVAALQHITAFDKRWKEMLADPGAGTQSLRTKFYDATADLMGDGYCTLPQVLSLLKTFPSDPLEQKQWLTKHVQQDEQAMQIMLAHHAMGTPANSDWATEQANLPPSPSGGPLANNHLDMMSNIANRYKAAAPRKPVGAPSSNAIPMR
jgi:hypothetical protein